jgi:hypothetical protein
MGALPKNKITRCERGKRRSGNTPNLLKNPQKTSIPLGRQRLADQILKKFKAIETKTNKSEKVKGKAKPKTAKKTK